MAAAAACSYLLCNVPLRFAGLDTTCGGSGPNCDDVKSHFFSSPLAQQLYKQYVSTLISRVNTINGRPYVQDTTIWCVPLRLGSVVMRNCCLPHAASFLCLRSACMSPTARCLLPASQGLGLDERATLHGDSPVCGWCRHTRNRHLDSHDGRACEVAGQVGRWLAGSGA
jgi:hypothetical protein